MGKFSCFQSNDDPSRICQRLLTSIGEEFSRAQITTKVGGGFIGSMFYQLIFPILGTVGSEVISLLMMLVWGLDDL